MLRMHFTAGDLARTRVADGPDPLWESVLSLHRLQERRPEPPLAAWRKHVLGEAAAPLRLLLPLVPARGYFPDFLTPAATQCFESGLDALLSTPRSRLRHQIGLLAENAPLDPWARSLREGASRELQRLGTALRDYRRTALGASWQQIRARVAADRAWRARVQWHRGTDAMLRTFRPGIRWEPPVLRCDYPVEKDVHLGGRGLLLIPSYFCRRTPVALADDSLPPTLVYPAVHPAGARRGGPAGPGAEAEAGGGRAEAGRPNDPGGQAAPAPAPAPVSVSVSVSGGYERCAHLARLLGPTRAAVLLSVGGNCTTSELAERAGVSVSSASEHASVLRRAGLIHSSRQRNAVRHALTPIGLALLEGPAPGSPAAASLEGAVA